MAALDGYVTREELAEELKITPRTLDRWAWLDRGPRKVKIGARCWYSRDAIATWLKAEEEKQGKAA